MRMTIRNGILIIATTSERPRSQNRISFKLKLSDQAPFRSSLIVKNLKNKPGFSPQISNRCSLGQFKSAKLKDKYYTKFLHNVANKKEIDAPSFQHLSADSQLLLYVANAVLPSIRYLCFILDILINIQKERKKDFCQFCQIRKDFDRNGDRMSKNEENLPHLH